MTLRQQVFALVGAMGLLVFIVEMVRRRRLREEYSWLWILTGVAVLVLSVWFHLLEWLTHLIGAVVPVSTLFVFGILFLVVVNIHFSVKISTLTNQVKNQAQRLAIVDHYVRELQRSTSDDTVEGKAGATSDLSSDPWLAPTQGTGPSV
jgi:hypothetical protein